MIKWIICLLLGHDYTEDYKYVHREWFDDISYSNEKLYWCERCKKYKSK